MTKRVLLLARDPGGANTVIPLINPLKARGYDVRIFGKDAALKKYQGQNIPGINIMDELPAVFTEQDLYRFLIKERPDCIITGTSADDFTEKYIWAAAQKLGKPTFAILDQWINYGVRFSQYSVHELEIYNRVKQHSYLPTLILVMDEMAQQGLLAEGIPAERVVISGQPHFEMIVEKCKKFTSAWITGKRSEWGFSDNDFLITFASEPISGTYKETDDSEHYWGYTERSIAKHLIAALDEIAVKTERKISVIFKLHPKEKPENYTDIIQSYHGPLRLLQDGKADAFELMMASDLICGMSSMFLLEAIILRKPTISIQIGLKRETPFILDRIGVLPSIVQENNLLSFLQGVIIEGRRHKTAYTPTPNAINNFIRIVEDYL